MPLLGNAGREARLPANEKPTTFWRSGANVCALRSMGHRRHADLGQQGDFYTVAVSIERRITLCTSAFDRNRS